jgi:hypothetical protein
MDQAVAKDDWIPATPDTVPPSGWILVRENTTGKDFWVDPKTLKRGSPVSQLSAEQQGRIRRIASVLQEHDSSSVEEWLDNMSRDHRPEGEIRLWEDVVKVYEAELLLRPTADHMQRRLLYGVLVSATMLPGELCTPEKLLSSLPAAKGLVDLERVVERFRETRG